MERGPTDNGPDQVVVKSHTCVMCCKRRVIFVHYREFNGGHEYLNWRGTLADALLVLVGKGAAENGSKPR